MSASVVVGGEHFQWDCEAEAGVNLSDGQRWWGTRVKWRPCIKGRWQTFLLVDVHPFDVDNIRGALVQVIERTAIKRTSVRG